MSEETTHTPNALYLAIDQGGHASRVMVFNTLGEIVAQASRDVAVFHPQPGWVEQDGDALEISIRAALDDVVVSLGKKSESIVAAGLATQRSNVVCWDRETGRPLTPVMSWQDVRASRWMDQFKTHSRRIQQLTGLLPTAHYGVSKLVWCQENVHDVQQAQVQKTLAWGPLSSFLLFRLLDEKPIQVDPANASRTLLWDIKQADWSAELLGLFGLSREYLPECVPSRGDFGTLDVGGCRVPLTVCTGDQSAALFAFGRPESGVANINIGTGAFLQVVTETPAANDAIAGNNSDSTSTYSDRLLRSIVWSDADKSVLVSEATVNGAGSAVQQVEDELTIASSMVQEHLPEWLASVEDIPLYLNGVSGLGSPFWVAHFESRFVGDSGPEEKMVAVIESIIFLLQVNLEEMKSAGIMPNRILVSGGLSVLDGLCQRLADLSGLPVTRPKECESTAKGLAYLISDRQTPWEAGPGSSFQPGPDKKLLDRYHRWRQEMETALD